MLGLNSESSIGQASLSTETNLEVQLQDKYKNLEVKIQGGAGGGGRPGKDGKSAYQIAVENGFIGTEEEWLVSLKGKDGKNGVDGKPGKDGKDGINGEQGAKGEPGEKGEQGIPGEKGKDGKNGVDGKPGKDGLQGVDGQDGHSPTVSIQEGDKIHTIIITDKLGSHQTIIKDGKDGKNGERGLQGEQGIPGEKGEQGLPGVDGKNGEKGEQGIPGEKGKDGLPGKNATINGVNTLTIKEGANISLHQSGDSLTISATSSAESGKSQVDSVNGQTGVVILDADDIAFTDGETFQQKLNSGKLKGQDGAKGLQGEQGLPGKNGTDGKPGAKGDQGEKGQDGESAYEIARRLGKPNTESESGWVDSLKGQKGDQGLQGEKGAKGDDGLPGVNGKDGEPGKQGVKGDDGFSPIVSISEGENIHTITITDKSGIHQTIVRDGVDGKNGSDGQKGQDGLPGKDGQNGVKGDAGESAYQIAKRLNPEIGTEQEWIASLKGKDGANGAPGQKGDQGLQGERGKDGAPGKDGQQGAKGETGANGKDGVSPVVAIQEGVKQHTISITDSTGTKTTVIKDGKDGAPGSNGTNGSNGDKGDAGESAYEIARRLGKPHTESEDVWINSLKGDKGEQGAEGKIGPTGERGEQGPEGKPNPNADSVNGLKFWYGTIEQYNNIVPKDEKTVYIIS